MDTDVVTENPWAASREKEPRSIVAWLGVLAVVGAIALLLVAARYVGVASAAGGCGGG